MLLFFGFLVMFPALGLLFIFWTVCCTPEPSLTTVLISGQVPQALVARSFLSSQFLCLSL